MTAARWLAFLAAISVAFSVAACGRKDEPDQPSGKAPANVYPKPDAMPGAAPAPPTPAKKK